MTQWYVKELSKLTGVSVRTLHHYDAISLLKPSLRLANGYRLYSEKDLSNLQQIIALKFFGFELAQIKTLLEGDLPIIDHFILQSKFLEEKANNLLEASKTLKCIIQDCEQDKSLPWQKFINLIEVYRMTQQLENSWAGKVLSPEQLKEYATFEANLKTRFTDNDRSSFDKKWANLISQIEKNLEHDPRSEIGTKLAKQCMEMINNLYGTEHAELRHNIWHRGYKEGQVDGKHPLKPEVVSWLDKAMDAYYRCQIYNILDQATKNSVDLVTKWNALMEEMFGTSDDLKQSIIDLAMTDSRVSVDAREWLQQFIKK